MNHNNLISALFATALPFIQPNVLYSQPPYINTALTTQIDCPESKDAKNSFQNYGIENLVAQSFDYPVSLKRGFTTITREFVALAYNPSSEYEKIDIIDGQKGISAIFQRSGVEVIELYDKNPDGTPKNWPFVTIIRNSKISESKGLAYVKSDFNDIMGHEGNTEESCSEKWSEDTANRKVRNYMEKFIESLGDRKWEVPSFPERPNSQNL